MDTYNSSFPGLGAAVCHRLMPLLSLWMMILGTACGCLRGVCGYKRSVCLDFRTLLLIISTLTLTWIPWTEPVSYGWGRCSIFAASFYNSPKMQINWNVVVARCVSFDIMYMSVLFNKMLIWNASNMKTWICIMLLYLGALTKSHATTTVRPHGMLQDFSFTSSPRVRSHQPLPDMFPASWSFTSNFCLSLTDALHYFPKLSSP